MSEVKDFSKGYDLTGASVEYRREQAKKRVVVLEEELELLATGKSFQLRSLSFVNII